MRLLLSGCMVLLTLGGWGQAGELPGFPQPTGGSLFSSPAVGDIDGDGHQEIVNGCYDGNLYAFNHDGSPVIAGASTTVLMTTAVPAGGSQPAPILSTPTLVDLDGDNIMEIIVGADDGIVYLLDLQPGAGGTVTARSVSRQVMLSAAAQVPDATLRAPARALLPSATAAGDDDRLPW